MSSKIPIVVTFFFIFLFPTAIIGQLTARGLGMGGAYTALARGVHAPLWNPANLGLPDNPSFSFTGISLAAGFSNNSITKEMYDRYNGTHLTTYDAEDILKHIPEDGFGLDMEATLSTLCFSVDRFALTMSVMGGHYLQLDKDCFDILLVGTKIGKTYSLKKAANEWFAVGLLGLSWGHPVKLFFTDHFAIGGTINILYGGVYGCVNKAEFSLISKTSGFDVDGNLKYTNALGNLGWGADVGIAAQFGKRNRRIGNGWINVGQIWTVSLGLANVLGGISWSKKIESNLMFISGDSLNIIRVLDTSDLNSVISDSSWMIEGQRFSTKLPTMLRLGCTYEQGSLIMTVDYCQGFRNGALSSTRPQFALGAEWRWLKWLPLRMGVILGGRPGFGTSFGFGIRPGSFVLDFGVLNYGYVSVQSSKGFVLALELGMQLNKRTRNNGSDGS
ncbi:MAG: DUF5723 family protein [bacterium]